MTRAKPYTDAEIAERRENPLCVYVLGREPRLDEREQRWLATVDALQARLAAAESECCAREEVQARLIRERNAAEAEAERLRSVLRQTHANYCEAAWTDRGLHAPECLIEHLDDDEPSRPEGEVAGG